MLGSLVLIAALAGCAGEPWRAPTTSSSAARLTEPGTSASPSPTAPPAPERATPAETFAAIPELPDLRFVSGRVTVSTADVALLDGVVRWLKDNPGARVLIEGHTDDLGSREANLAVSEKRVESVRGYLIQKEIEPARISVVSYGPDRPLCRDKSSACRAKNRRIHFLVAQP
jgi:outer membrane protein OmpA-like peptidoglycan-associated protein